MENIDSVRYPVGKYEKPDKVLKSDISRWRKEIERLPRDLKKLVAGWNNEQLDSPYRDGGWTVRQVIHHLADSHINAYCRIKWALTEDNPTVKPYEEKLWAELSDARTADIKSSLQILTGIHKRWGLAIRAMSKEDYKRTFFHPVNGSNQSIGEIIGMYAWHGRHHLAHIQNLKTAKGW
jgi:hypothetical protein